MSNLSYAKITIGITCFNAIDTIERAINSALNQDWPNYEILIVDDFSVDGSWEIIQKIKSLNTGITAIQHSKNLGASAARNSIIQNANGDYIVFFDDDDESFNFRIRVQCEALISYQSSCGIELVACFASGVRKYPNGYELKMPAIASQGKSLVGSIVADYLLCNIRRLDLFYGSGTPTCAMMASKATFKKLEGFDPTLRRVEDIDFNVRLALCGGHFIGCDRNLFTQYATYGDYKSPINNFKAELQMLHKHSIYLRSQNNYEYACDWFYIRFLHFSGKNLKFFLKLIVFLSKYPIQGGKHVMLSLPSRLVHERRIRFRS
jgi:glycosyltransferase involved in cell wall biosynthesis